MTRRILPTLFCAVLMLCTLFASGARPRSPGARGRERSPAVGSVALDQYCVQGDGITKYLRLQTGAALGYGSNGATVDYWIKSTYALNDWMAAHYAASPRAWGNLWATGNTFRILLIDQAGAAQNWYSNETIADDTWTHIAWQWSPSTHVKAWKNGVEFTWSAAGTPPVTLENSTGIIGASIPVTVLASSNGTANASGCVAFFALRTDATIDASTLYNGGAFRDPTSDTGIKIWWRFGDYATDAYPTIVNAVNPGTYDTTMTNMDAADIVKESWL